MEANILNYTYVFFWQKIFRSFPIMAHPPETSSDLSLSTFISTLNNVCMFLICLKVSFFKIQMYHLWYDRRCFLTISKISRRFCGHVGAFD